MYIKLSETNLSTEDFQNIIVYGILVFEDDNLMLDVKDISVNKEFVQSIINKIEKHDASIYHVIDIIEDEII